MAGQVGYRIHAAKTRVMFQGFADLCGNHRAELDHEPATCVQSGGGLWDQTVNDFGSGWAGQQRFTRLKIANIGCQLFVFSSADDTVGCSRRYRGVGRVGWGRADYLSAA